MLTQALNQNFSQEINGDSNLLITEMLFCFRGDWCLLFISETKNPRTLEAHEAKMKFFTVDTLTEICRRLVAHYFLLTQEELHSWDSDPEEFSKKLCCVKACTNLWSQ